MSTASQTALATAELLEAVLCALPTKDLLLAQRVCQVWRDAIQGSKKIQEALFFQPIAVIDAECGVPVEDDLLFEEYETWPDDPWHEASSHKSLKHLLGNTLAIDNDGYLDIPFFHDLDKTSTCHNMFITQPAITSCTFTMAGKVDGIVCSFTETIEDDDGITIGKLFDHVITEWPERAARVARNMTRSYSGAE